MSDKGGTNRYETEAHESAAQERQRLLGGLMDSYDAKLLDRAKYIEPADLEPTDGEFLDLTVTVTMEREAVEGIVGRKISDELFAAQ